MARPLQEQLGNINELDRDETGSVDLNNADLINAGDGYFANLYINDQPVTPGGGSSSLTEPTQEEDGYVAIASGEDLTYLAGEADGYVLTWNASLGQWEGQEPQGGSGGSGGGFTDEQIDGYSDGYIIAPNEGISHLVEVQTTTIGAASTIYLPSSPNVSEIIVKDSEGDATTYNITVDGNGNDIDGQPNVVINIDDDFVRVRWSSSGEWRMV